MVVSPFASMPEVLLPITQTTAAVTRVDLHPREFVPQNHAVTLSLLLHWAMLSTDPVLKFLNALQPQTPVEEAKMCIDLAAKQQLS